MENADFEIQLTNVVYMWTEIYSERNPDFEAVSPLFSNDDEEGGMHILLTNNFDYDDFTDNEWHFYHYLGIRMPRLARITLRLDYLIVGEIYSWEVLFEKHNITQIVSHSVDRTVKAFKEFCSTNGLDLSPDFALRPEEIDDMEKTLSEGMTEAYHTHRKDHDRINYEAQHTVSLQCPQSTKINVTLNLAFLVMDEVLFDNTAFKRNHNRDVFFEQVPECRYYTLKMKCMKINRQQVDLTILDTKLFLIVLDCSLQILLGDKVDFLIPVLDGRGAVEKVRDIFFKSATELFNLFKGQTLAPVPTDWNALIG